METRVHRLVLPMGLPWQLAGGLRDALARQRGHLFLFAPVCLALGIGTYFGLPREPVAAEWAALGGAALLLALAARWLGEEVAPLALGALLVICGVLITGHRAHQVAGPVLNLRFYGALEGRIVKIDRSASDALRLTLDQVRLEGVAPARTPQKVRLSLHDDHAHLSPEPGLRVMTTGHLGPPPAPSEPGGFDFRRMAWFEGLGAVGYTRIPVLVAAPASDGAKGLAIHRLRMRISRAVQDRLPGDRGGFAAAILTGDRSGISQEQTEHLRRANLAHLLAISGLHMGLLTGFVFGLLRLVMALVPLFALRVPIRKLAAIGALGAGAFYLVLSGGNVATERAFIMVAVMLVAVLLDRRAISLRSVAIAAMIILTLRPEALVQAGFQMSFAATIALVAVFRVLSDERDWRARVPRWALPVISVVICSLVAGIATAPIAAASFNRIAEYGLIANLLTVPLMGMVIMPAAVLAAILAPFGLEWIGLAIMSPAIGWVLTVAEQVSALPGAVMPIVEPDWPVIPLMSLGALWLILWQGAARWAGPVAMALALALWVMTERPTLLIAPEGEIVGLMGSEGRILSRARSGSFTAESWLKSDGDSADQAQAHARSGAGPRDPVVHLQGGGFDLVHLSGKRALEDLPALCLPGRIVVTNTAYEGPGGPCTLITPAELRATGAQAYRWKHGRVQMQSVAQTSGQRYWSRD